MRDAWLGKETEVTRQEVVFMLKPYGGISEHISTIDEVLGCGCRADVAGICSLCLGTACARCFARCEKCSAAIGSCCWEKNRDDCSDEIHLCPVHNDDLRETRFWLALVSPFYGPRR